DLARAGPDRVAGPERRAERPEGRPQSLAALRKPEPGIEPYGAAGRGSEVGAAGLDAGGGPPVRGAPRGQRQVAPAVQAEVRGVAGGGLDLAGTPVRGCARVPVSG